MTPCTELVSLSVVYGPWLPTILEIVGMLMRAPVCGVFYSRAHGNNHERKLPVSHTLDDDESALNINLWTTKV